MVGQSVSQAFKGRGQKIMPISATPIKGWMVVDTDESTGTAVIEKKPKVK